jgi:hypothetical protein
MRLVEDRSPDRWELLGADICRGGDHSVLASAHIGDVR